MKCKLTNYDLNHIKPEQFNDIYLYPNKNFTIEVGDVIDLEYNCKLELHLRNSEVIGLIAVPKERQNVFRVISHTLFKPLRGTHDNLYIKIEGTYIDPILFSDNELESKPLLVIRLISKTYWELLKKKCIDGITSVPIEIELNKEI